MPEEYGPSTNGARIAQRYDEWFSVPGDAEPEHGSVTMYPVKLRFAYPPELDLMARLAGLRLRQRFAGWRSEPFSASSGQHISMYERAP